MNQYEAWVFSKLLYKKIRPVFLTQETLFIIIMSIKLRPSGLQFVTSLGPIWNLFVVPDFVRKRRIIHLKSLLIIIITSQNSKFILHFSHITLCFAQIASICEISEISNRTLTSLSQNECYNYLSSTSESKNIWQKWDSNPRTHSCTRILSMSNFLSLAP